MTFFTDLDNTLIYSYKHETGPQKVNVEIYQGREISFMTKYSYELLQKVSRKLLLVPVTTRTTEQYDRIDLGITTPEYALVCNGGILLKNGKEDRQWYQDSLHMVSDTKDEMKYAYDFLEKDSRRIFDLRFIRGLFIFTKCQNPREVVRELKDRLDLCKVNVFYNGSKVYVLPKILGKGQGIKRLHKYTGGGITIAAGDSEFDISMLNEADAAVAPAGLKDQGRLGEHTIFMPGEKCFSDELLSYVTEWCENQALVSGKNYRHMF